MGFIVSAPSYMYQSPSGYIFRLRIPKDLKQLVGKVEFRYSLRSGSLRIAKDRARSIASFIQQLFAKVRDNMSDFTQEKIKRIVQNYIRETLSNNEKCRAISGPATEGTTTLDGMSILESSDMKSGEARFLAEGVDVESESTNYKLLGRELLKVFQGILNVRMKRSDGDYSVADHELIP